MRDFDFYEFAGVLAPGATFLFGASLLLPDIGARLQSQEGFTIGDLGLFTILAYVAGHLIQAVGNGLEVIWWKPWGGMPTDWPKIDKHDLISSSQREQLRESIRKMLSLPDGQDPFSTPAKQWPSIVRQADALVQAAGRSKRVEIFNGNYGLNRGIASALLSLSILALCLSPCCHWKVVALCLVGSVVAVYRMHRFGRHYGRELFVQFLAIQSGTVPPKSEG